MAVAGGIGAPQRPWFVEPVDSSLFYRCCRVLVSVSFALFPASPLFVPALLFLFFLVSVRRTTAGAVQLDGLPVFQSSITQWEAKTKEKYVGVNYGFSLHTAPSATFQLAPAVQSWNCFLEISTVDFPGPSLNHAVVSVNVNRHLDLLYVSGRLVALRNLKRLSGRKRHCNYAFINCSTS